MASWTEQMVKVTKETWQNDKVTLELEQLWFLSDGGGLTAEETERKWTVPVITCTADGTQKDIVYMREKTATIALPVQKGSWVKLNMQIMRLH
jgi:hypothetical protein